MDLETRHGLKTEPFVPHDNGYKSPWENLGLQILNGEKVKEIKLKGRTYKFSYSKEEFMERARKSGWEEEYTILGEKVSLEQLAERYKATQSDFISDFKSDFCLNSGGFGSGKSLALYIKLILLVKCFPGNRVLLGRKTLSDIDRAVLPDLFDILPPSWYEHRVKDGLINFSNGSQIILFGLDAMQTGSVADIKKAEQKLKSLNLGAYFIDQLEEVEYPVFEVLNSRLRRVDVPFRQGNMDSNPANFWAYHQFKLQQKWNGENWTQGGTGSTLYETSMLYNPHLPGDYIRRQLGMGEDYVRRFVLGEWSTDLLLKGTVFSREDLSWFGQMVRPPVAIEEGCEIYEQPRPNVTYRMGVDPSEGVVDPSSITVLSSEGRKVAKFNGKLPVQGLADRVKFLYYKYGRPLVIPESNAAGTALIREIRDLNVYRRKVLQYKTDVETEKLGFRTSSDTKSQLINHFKGLLRDKSIKIYDRNTVEEMKSFMWTDDAKQQGAGAARGFHDDDVMSTMLACWDFTPEAVEREDVLRYSPPKPLPKRRFQYS